MFRYKVRKRKMVRSFKKKDVQYSSLFVLVFVTSPLRAIEQTFLLGGIYVKYHISKGFQVSSRAKVDPYQLNDRCPFHSTFFRVKHPQ